MESGAVPGEYGLLGFIVVVIAVGGLASLGLYAALKLGLKNPDDIP